MARCDRCNEVTDTTTGSYFDLAMICPACEQRERKHPRFKDAVAAENKALSHGDWKFKGIGFPGWPQPRRQRATA